MITFAFRELVGCVMKRSPEPVLDQQRNGTVYLRTEFWKLDNIVIFNKALRKKHKHFCQSGKEKNWRTWKEITFNHSGGYWNIIYNGQEAEDMSLYISEYFFSQFLIEFWLNHISVQGMYGYYIDKKLAF